MGTDVLSQSVTQYRDERQNTSRQVNYQGTDQAYGQQNFNVNEGEYYNGNVHSRQEKFQNNLTNDRSYGYSNMENRNTSRERFNEPTLNHNNHRMHPYNNLDSYEQTMTSRQTKSMSQ